MTLDYYLVRHDLRVLFHLGDHHDGWGYVFPVTSGKIHRFGPDLLGQLPELVKKTRLASFGPPTISGFDEASGEDYVAEVVRRIQTWATDAPGVYCIVDNGDHFDFVKANGYRITGTRFARRTGDWWLDEFDWDADELTVVVATHADGSRVAVTFADRGEGHAFYRSATQDQIEHHRAVLEVNDPKTARA